jgi:hypothetical protein
MSLAVQSYSPNKFIISSLDGKKSFDLTNSLLSFDYYEDILSPCIMMTANIMTTYSILNILPIRGGEGLSVDIDVASGKFFVDGEKKMYVYKVTDIRQTATVEVFTLYLISGEGLINETVRCLRKYPEVSIDLNVRKILTDDLKVPRSKIGTIEKTYNAYSFIGNNRKPFHILTWLSTKSVPLTGRPQGTSGSGETGEAKGTAGFLFFENKDGFHFRSLDSLVSNTQLESSSSNKKNIPTYTYNPGIIEANNLNQNFTIKECYFEKNIDLLKSLRVGMYANKNYFYDLHTQTLDIYGYRLKDHLKNKLGNDELSISKFSESFSRVMVSTSSRGALKPDGTTGIKEINSADTAMAYSRYNLLFTQALNIVIPVNITLKVGDIIRVVFQSVERSDNKEADEQQSGNYLIANLHHHFEAQQLVTSLKLVRDSYGFYGATNQ